MTACRIAWYPLALGETLCVFGYHVHDPEYAMGDIIDEVVSSHGACVVNPPALVLHYDPVTGVVYSTPVGGGGPRAVLTSDESRRK